MEAGAGREGGGASDGRGLETCPLSPLQKFEGEFKRERHMQSISLQINYFNMLTIREQLSYFCTPPQNDMQIHVLLFKLVCKTWSFCNKLQLFAAKT